MTQVYKIISFLLLALSVVVPLGLWWFVSKSPPDVSTFSQIMKSLGQIFGLVGASLLSLNIILSSRARFIENLLGGLNRVYINHHLIGIYAFILILFHPLFLSFQYLPVSVMAATKFFLVPLSDIPMWFGILANILFILLLILTLYVSLPYEIWKKTHKFLGVVQALALLHVATIPGNLTDNLPLKYYMVTISSVALLFYVYNTLLGRFLTRKLPYKVIEVKQIVPKIWEITMQPKDKRIHFFPGQFIFVTPVDSQIVKHEQHPFSISSANDNMHLSFTAKALGDFTESLQFLKPGNLVKVEGPYGKFIFILKKKKQIWIAGGIGITPFMSMVRQIKAYPDFDFQLFYTVKNDNEAAFMSELQQAAASYPNIHLHLVRTEKEGRLTVEKISQHVTDYKQRVVFLCGPPPMMKSLRQQFNKLGLGHSRIISEEFSLY